MEKTLWQQYYGADPTKKSEQEQDADLARAKWDVIQKYVDSAQSVAQLESQKAEILKRIGTRSFNVNDVIEVDAKIADYVYTRGELSRLFNQMFGEELDAAMAVFVKK